MKPDRIISVGDFFDLNSFSKFPSNPELYSPNHELELAIDAAQDWYEEFPEVDICTSNHDARIFRKAAAGGLPSRVLKEFAQIVGSPSGWRWEQDFIDLDDYVVMHGDSLTATSSKTAYNRYKASVVHGHTHSGLGVNYSQSRGRRYFSLNVGCTIDPRQRAFDYAKWTIERATLGCGFIIDGDEAMAVPMPEKMQKSFT